MLMAKKKSKKKRREKKTGERKDYWNRSKVFFGLPHTCVRKTAKREGQRRKKLNILWQGEVGTGEGREANPSQGREFYKTAIVVGGVSCRPFAGRL